LERSAFRSQFRNGGIKAFDRGAVLGWWPGQEAAPNCSRWRIANSESIKKILFHQVFAG